MKRFVRTFSKASRYGHAVGRIMVHEAMLLKGQQVRRMIESDFKEALDVSLETVYGPYLEGATVPGEIEDGLERFLVDEYGFFDDVCEGTLVAEFMYLKYDFHNMRVLLKRRFLGDSGDDRLLSGLGGLDMDEMSQAIEGQLSLQLPGYSVDLVERVRSVVERGGADAQRIDTVIDRAFLERRLEVAQAEGSELLVGFCRAAIDVANLRVLLRGIALGKERSFYEEALADGGKLERKQLLEISGEPFGTVSERLLESRYGRMLTGVLEAGEERVRLTSLDRVSDEYLLKQVHGFSRVSVGPERIVRFMLTRENEVAMLRVIFMGKLHGLAPEVIEAGLPVESVE